jgi:hypothetical protein
MSMTTHYTTLNGQMVYENSGGIRRYFGAGVCGVVSSVVEQTVPPMELYECRPAPGTKMWRVFPSMSKGHTGNWKNDLGEQN